MSRNSFLLHQSAKKFILCILSITFFLLFLNVLHADSINEHILELDKKQKFLQVVKIFQSSKIETVDGDILLKIGFYYLEGRKGIAVDKVKSLRLFNLAENKLKTEYEVNRKASTLYHLGLAIRYSRFDYVESFKLIKEAADKGNSMAQVELSLMLLKGLGTKADSDMAMTYLNRAIVQNNLTAKAYLASYYLSKKQELPKGIALAQESSDLGNRSGQYTLAMAYEKGIGVDKNERRALFLYQLSADQGLEDAKDRLAWLKKKMDIPNDEYIDSPE